MYILGVNPKLKSLLTVQWEKIWKWQKSLHIYHQNGKLLNERYLNLLVLLFTLCPKRNIIIYIFRKPYSINVAVLKPMRTGTLKFFTLMEIQDILCRVVMTRCIVIKLTIQFILNFFSFYLFYIFRQKSLCKTYPQRDEVYTDGCLPAELSSVFSNVGTAIGLTIVGLLTTVAFLNYNA